MKKIVLLLYVGFFALSCADKTPNPEPTPNSKRTVLVYIEADNDLYSDALNDINEMEEGWDNSIEGTLLVFFNPRNSVNPTIPARLYKIVKGQPGNSAIESTIVKEYAIKTNACDPTVLSGVIKDVRNLYPSENYGLVLWSHGSGWIPKGLVPLSAPKDPGIQYSFGSDWSNGRATMEISDLQKALPRDVVFDFIASDACFMASVEAAYQLRNNTKYFVASSAETHVDGFPYDKITKDLMTANVVGIATKAFNYYNVLSGAYKSSTMSVIDCTKLPALAGVLKQIIETSTQPGLPTDIQQFGRGSFKNIFYDLADFVNKTWPEDSPRLAAFNTAINSAVIYKNSTPTMFEGWSGWFVVTAHSGLTAYIPRASQPNTIEVYRQEYHWSTDSGLATITF